MQHSGQANYKYLIGGMDLEMATIIELLEQNGLQIINLHLSWGASLSAYKAYFNDQDTFVGIELTQDIEPPKHYICLDHHNENSGTDTLFEHLFSNMICIGMLKN